MRHFSPVVEFKKGLRPLENAKAEQVYLVKASGVLFNDGAFHSIPVETLMPTPDPLVQIEQLKNLILVVSTTTIYEFINGGLVPKITTPSSSIWGIADYGEFILLFSKTKTIARDPLSHAYSEVTDVPKSFDALNYNGQCILIGSEL